MFPVDIGLVISTITSLAAGLGWYRSNARNQYAREREYAHILKNLEQASAAHQEIYKELDAVTDRLSRLEIILLRNTGVN